MSHAAPNAAAAAGRVLMSIIFLLSGFQKLTRFSGTTAYMASQGLPAPDLAALVAIVVECIGGLLILIGYRTRVVGLVLAVWCIATALIAHTNFADPNQMVHFLKNLAMAGGFLQLAAFGGGAWSIDFRSVRALQGAV
jgi:putative oxidoreductase